MSRTYPGLDVNAFTGKARKEIKKLNDHLINLSRASSPNQPVTPESAPAASAPADGTYVTIAVEPGLSNERRLRAVLPIEGTDNGAGNTVDIEFDEDTELLTGYVSSVNDDTAAGTITFSNADPIALTDANPVVTWSDGVDVAGQLTFRPDGPSPGHISAAYEFEGPGAARFLFVVASAGATTFSMFGGGTFLAPSGNINFTASAGITRFNSPAEFEDGVVFETVTVAGPGSLTLTDSHHYVTANTASGAVTFTLPASPDDGRHYSLKKTGDTNLVTLAGNGKNIDGLANRSSTSPYFALEVIYNSTVGEWEIR